MAEPTIDGSTRHPKLLRVREEKERRVFLSFVLYASYPPRSRCILILALDHNQSQILEAHPHGRMRCWGNIYTKTVTSQEWIPEEGRKSAPPFVVTRCGYLILSFPGSRIMRTDLFLCEIPSPWYSVIAQ